MTATFDVRAIPCSYKTHGSLRLYLALHNNSDHTILGAFGDFSKLSKLHREFSRNAIQKRKGVFVMNKDGFRKILSRIANDKDRTWTLTDPHLVSVSPICWHARVQYNILTKYTPPQVDMLFKAWDRDNNGEISFQEFLRVSFGRSDMGCPQGAGI